jgi:hypothetical protein
MGMFSDLRKQEVQASSGRVRPALKRLTQRPDTQTPKIRGAETSRILDTQESRPPGVHASPHQEVEASALHLATGYDLTDKAEDRQTLRLTEREFRRLNLLQNQLGIALDVKKVDKNDIMRCAIQRVFEEFERDGVASNVVERLKKKYR